MLATKLHSPSNRSASYPGAAPNDIRRSANYDIHDQHRDLFGTLGAHISHLANEDVVMESVSLSDDVTIFIPDTNIFLHYFEVLEDFVATVEQYALPIRVVIPGIVIAELDRQKEHRRHKMWWFSRRASLWILNKMKEKKTIKGQALSETRRTSGSWQQSSGSEDVALDNDDLIADCCLFFRRQHRVVLLSADHNLCIKCESEGIVTVTRKKDDHCWSSRTIASEIFPNWKEQELEKFAEYHQGYSGKSVITDDGTELDLMDVDEVEDPDVISRQDVRDLLHEQIITHFTMVLADLVGRNGGSALRPTMAVSIHAPKWQKTSKHFREWDATLLLEYLGDRKEMETTQPRLEAFLSKPYSRGARRGKEWAAKDWLVALRALGKLGEAWNDTSIAESLVLLRPHVEIAFRQPMDIFEIADDDQEL